MSEPELTADEKALLRSIALATAGDAAAGATVRLEPA